MNPKVEYVKYVKYEFKKYESKKCVYKIMHVI